MLDSILTWGKCMLLQQYDNALGLAADFIDIFVGNI